MIWLYDENGRHFVCDDAFIPLVGWEGDTFLNFNLIDAYSVSNLGISVPSNSWTVVAPEQNIRFSY